MTTETSSNPANGIGDARGTDGRCPNCGEDEIDGARCYYCGWHDYDCGLCDECRPTPPEAS